MTVPERKTCSPGRRFSILALLGILLILVSLVGIHFAPDLLQYALLPSSDSRSISPQVPPDPSDIESSMEEEDSSSDISSRSSADSSTTAISSPARDALDHYASLVSSSVWAGENPVMTLQGQKSHSSVSRSSGTSIGDVRLLFAGPRFFEVYPEKLTEGRGISDAEVRSHSLSAVLDSRWGHSASPFPWLLRCNDSLDSTGRGRQSDTGSADCLRMPHPGQRWLCHPLAKRN